MKLELKTYITTPAGTAQRIMINFDKRINLANYWHSESCWAFLVGSRLRSYIMHILMMNNPKSYYSNQTLTISKFRSQSVIVVKNFFWFGSVDCNFTYDISNRLVIKLNEIISKSL